MAFLTGLGVGVGPPMGPFRLDMGGYAQDTWGETGTHTEGMSLATHLPIHPPPRWPSWPV